MTYEGMFKLYIPPKKGISNYCLKTSINFRGELPWVAFEVGTLNKSLFFFLSRI